MPCVTVYRLGTEQVGNHPLGAGRNLGGEVGVTGSGHLLRSGCKHVNIGHNHERSRTLERLLGILIYYGGAERRESVYGCGRGNAHIVLVAMVRRQLADVVYHSRTNGNRNGLRSLQHIVYHLDVLPLRMELLVRDNELHAVHTLRKHHVIHTLSGSLPGVVVGNDNSFLVREIAFEQLRHALQCTRRTLYGLGLSGKFQSLGNSLLVCHFVYGLFVISNNSRSVLTLRNKGTYFFHTL